MRSDLRPKEKSTAMQGAEAHEKVLDELPSFDRCFIIGNDAADLAAKTANQQRGSWVWDLWNRFTADVCWQTDLG